MFKRIICLVLPVLFLSICAAFAQRPELQGKKEVSLFGTFNITSDTKNINTNVAIGYFINNNVQIGPVFGGGFTFGDMDSFNGDAGFFLKYYFPTQSKTVPYVTGTGGVNFMKFSADMGELGSFSSTSTSGMASGGFGIKHFISENTSFFVQYDYMRVFAEGGGMNMSNGTFGFSALF